MPQMDWHMPQSTIETLGNAQMATMAIPALTFRVQASPAHIHGRNFRREPSGLQKEWRSTVGKADGLSVCLLMTGSITECMT